MDEIRETLEALKQLSRKHGKILSLRIVFKTLLKNRIYTSTDAIANCLRSLQKEKKIKPINFGIAIELLEDIDLESEEYVQSSLELYALKKRV